MRCLSCEGLIEEDCKNNIYCKYNTPNNVCLPVPSRYYCESIN